MQIVTRSYNLQGRLLPGAELDLLIITGSQRLGFEFKFSDAPKITKSMRIALYELKLDSLVIVTPTGSNAPLDEKISATGLAALLAGY